MSDQLLQRGCLLLAGAANTHTIDAYLAGLWKADPQQLILLDHARGVAAFDRSLLQTPLNRLTDTHWPIAAGRDLLASPELVAAVQAGLGSTSQILCFETFHLEVSLGMRLHREDWYVTLRDGSRNLLTAWILLEDVEAGALLYVPGSHSLEGFEDSKLGERHESVVMQFGEACERLGVERFSGRKGDVLLTRGSLGVGGALGASGSCRMLAAHFCPLADDPGYFAHLAPEFRVKRQFTRELYSSTVYVGRFN